MISELPFSSFGGMKIAQAEHGLVKGHCALATGASPWWFGSIADLPNAMRQFPQADTIFFYEGNLAALRAKCQEVAA